MRGNRQKKRKSAWKRKKDKRREDLSVTNRWLLSIVWGLTAIVAVTFGNLTSQIQSFNKELREVRDRIIVIETERRIEHDARLNTLRDLGTDEL